MIPGAFDYHAPASLEEALSLLSANVDDAKVLAGGQSLLPLMKLRLAKPEVIIDIGGLTELNYIREDGDHIAVGALATYTDVAESELILSRCPLLAQTAVVVGDVQVRNRGTVGGGLAHADPAEDLPAAILALDADIKAAGPDGERWLPASEFFITMLTTSLMPEELLTEIRVPARDGYKSAYQKASRQAAGFAIVGVAVCLKEAADGTCEDIAIGVTGVGDVAYRAEKVEAALRGQKLDDDTVAGAAALVTDGVDPIEDVNATPAYRSHLAQVYVERTIQAARAG